MRKAVLTRIETGDEGTFGEILTDSGFKCFSGELPWRNNAPGKSCIPAGIYVCQYLFSPKHGKCYHVDHITAVKGRSDIQIHSANWMGDETRGKKCQLLGCIAPGLKMGVLGGQKAVLASKQALGALEADLDRAEFELTISWGKIIGEEGA